MRVAILCLRIVIQKILFVATVCWGMTQATIWRITIERLEWYRIGRRWRGNVTKWRRIFHHRCSGLTVSVQRNARPLLSHVTFFASWYAITRVQTIVLDKFSVNGSTSVPATSIVITVALAHVFVPTPQDPRGWVLFITSRNAMVTCRSFPTIHGTVRTMSKTSVCLFVVYFIDYVLTSFDDIIDLFPGKTDMICR